MSSDGSNSDGSSDLEASGREKKSRSRTSGKLVEKRKKHDKHKKHKKAKKHKKHRHLSEAESEEKSDDASVSSANRKRTQQPPAPERQSGREAKRDRSLPREREPPQERPRPDKEDRHLLKQAPASRWDSPADGEGRHFHQSQKFDHSKSQRPRAQMEGRGDDRYQHNDERQQRDNNRRRSSPVARSRSPSPSADHSRGRGEYKQRRRYSDEDNRRGVEPFAHHEAVSARHEEHPRGNRNGREYRAPSPKQQQHHPGPGRYDDRRPKRNENYGDYNSGPRRTQEQHPGRGGGGDEGYQRRYPSPHHSYREQQQRGRGRVGPTDERDERQHRGEYRAEPRDQPRENRGPYGGQNRGWRGNPDDQDRNRRERDDDRERDRDRERERERERERDAPRGGSRPVEVKVERATVSPANARGRIRSHSPVRQPANAERPSANRNARERSPVARGQRREPFRPEQANEEEQFEWGGGARKDAAPKRSQPNQPHGQRVKEEGGGHAPKEEPGSDSEPAEAPKQKPDFGLSGKLTEETNKVNGTIIAYAEPPGARKPKRRWRLYPFKGEQALPTLYIHRQSCYLIGRDRKVCDLPVDHPSCSKQHAVLQYRLVPYQKDDGSSSQRVRPYIIDLESANGTFVNNKKIEPKRYLELREKDVLKFGFSSREYVLLHENSKEDNEDDDGYEVSPTSKPFAGANSNVGPN